MRTQQHLLIESGNFESLFKLFRQFIYEFVISRANLVKLIKNNSARKWKTLFQHPYWKTSFDIYFSNSLLISMFGPQAIQNAPKNSYPAYFKNVIEKGILKYKIETNYFFTSYIFWTVSK